MLAEGPVRSGKVQPTCTYPPVPVHGHAVSAADTCQGSWDSETQMARGIIHSITQNDNTTIIDNASPEESIQNGWAPWNPVIRVGYALTCSRVDM